MFLKHKILHHICLRWLYLHRIVDKQLLAWCCHLKREMSFHHASLPFCLTNFTRSSSERQVPSRMFNIWSSSFWFSSPDALSMGLQVRVSPPCTILGFITPITDSQLVHHYYIQLRILWVSLADQNSPILKISTLT